MFNKSNTVYKNDLSNLLCAQPITPNMKSNIQDNDLLKQTAGNKKEESNPFPRKYFQHI